MGNHSMRLVLANGRLREETRFDSIRSVPREVICLPVLNALALLPQLANLIVVPRRNSAHEADSVLLGASYQDVLLILRSTTDVYLP